MKKETLIIIAILIITGAIFYLGNKQETQAVVPPSSPSDICSIGTYLNHLPIGTGSVGTVATAGTTVPFYPLVSVYDISGGTPISITFMAKKYIDGVLETTAMSSTFFSSDTPLSVGQTAFGRTTFTMPNHDVNLKVDLYAYVTMGSSDTVSQNCPNRDASSGFQFISTKTLKVALGQPQPQCSDTEGINLNHEIKGTVTYDGATYSDVCQDTRYLKEYFCELDEVSQEIFDCNRLIDPDYRPYVCKSGKCVINTALVCKTDADTNCDNAISLQEIVAYGTLWLNGQVTRPQLAAAGQAWSG